MNIIQPTPAKSNASVIREGKRERKNSVSKDALCIDYERGVMIIELWTAKHSFPPNFVIIKLQF